MVGSDSETLTYWYLDQGCRSEGNSRSSSKLDFDRMQVLQRNSKRTFRVYDIQIVLKTAREKEKKAYIVVNQRSEYI